MNIPCATVIDVSKGVDFLNFYICTLTNLLFFVKKT